MNMISTVPFLAEADATNKQAELVKKLTAAWEKKNSKAARAGGVSLMAVSLAACGGEDTTPFSQADIDNAVDAVDTSADDAAAILAAVQAVDANATTVSEVATNAAAAVDTSADDAAAILAAVQAVDATATTVAGVATNAHAAGVSSVDTSADDAAAILAAVQAVDANATTVSEVATNAAAAVDTSADDDAAILLALRNEAAALGVTDTVNMTRAELVTAIKTANDTAVANAVDTSADDAAAINAAVAADTSFDTLAELVAAYNALANPTSYALTTGENSGSSFNASSSTTAVSFDATTSNSLSNGDVLVGGSGSDTLTASLNGAVVNVNTTAIETLNFTNVTAASTLNLASASGVTAIGNISSTADLTLNNIQAIPTVTINTNAVATTINFADAALTGDSDTMTINLEGISNPGTAGTGDIVVTRAAGATNNLEAITLNSTMVANSIEGLTTGAVNTTTLNVTGDQDLTIADTLDTDYTVVNASDFTGGLTATLSATSTTVTGGSGADSITIGSGDDTLSMGGGADTIITTADTAVPSTGFLSATISLDGGDGTDTLEISTDAATITDDDFTLVSNVETITSTTGQQIASLALGAQAAEAGIVNVTFNDVGTTDTVTLGALFTNDVTVTLDEDTANASATVTGTNYTGTLSVVANVTDMDDNASSLIGGTGTGDTLTLSVDETDDAILTGLRAIENITIADGDANNDHTSTVALANASTTYTSATVYDTMTVDATAIGASGDTINIDASLEADAKVVLKGGDGVNTITMSTSSNFGDTITAGGGNDIIGFTTAGFTSADSIDGGDGTDTIAGTAATNDLVDADFTLVTNVEQLSGGGALQDLNASLGALAQAAGIRTVTFTDEGSTGDDLTVEAGFTAALTVVLDDANTAASVVDASAYVGAGLTVQADAGDLRARTNTLTGSDNTNDTLNVTINGADTMVAQTGMTNFETILVTDGDTDNNHTTTVTVANENATYTNSSTYQTITVDATAIGASADTINVNASAESDAKVVINTGDGVSTITLSTSSNLGDTVSAGGGNDIIAIGASNLTAADSIDGGDGTDSINITADATVADAAFTGVSNVETITNDASVDIALTLGANAAAAGINTITLGTSAASDTDTIVIGSGFTNDLTINLDSDDANTNATANSVVATGYTGSLTVNVEEDDIDGTVASTLTGGSGTDTLNITSSDGNDAVTVTALSAFEIVNILEGSDTTTHDIEFTLANASVADGASITIDASTLTTDKVSIIGTAEADGAVTIKGGAGEDDIRGTQSDLGDTLEGNGGIDTFTFASAQLTSLDTVNGGAGVDILTLSDAATGTGAIVDADFTNVTSVETLNHSNFALTITLGAEAAEAGLVTLTGGTGANITTLGAGFTNDIAVSMLAGTETLTASSYTGDLTVTGDIDVITSADTLTAGGSGTDILTITLDGVTDLALGAADLANVSGFDEFKVGSNVAAGITTHDNNVASGTTMNVTSAAMTTAALTFNGSAELDGNFNITAGGTGDHQITLGYGDDTYTSTSTADEDVTATAGNNTITTGDGADTIVGGTGADTMNGEAGDDIFKFTSANLNSSDTINGGAGDDTIKMTDAATVVDADFTNASSIKTLTGSSTINATLGAEAAESGLTVITLADADADTVNVGAGFTNALTINMASDATNADSIVATNYTGSLTVNADVEELDTNTATLTGGSGSDTLAITVTTGATALLDGVTNFDTIDIGGDGLNADTIVITTADTLVADGATLTIDGADLEDGATDDILTFNGSAETNGHFIITTDGAGAHTITLGAGNDTYTGSGSGDTTVTATAGTNSITTGTGADTITAGSGTDTIAGGTGSDTFVFGSATNALNDSITDFVSADDQISVTLNYSSLLSGVVVNGNRTSTGVEGVSAAEATLTGQRGEYVYDTTNSKLYVNMTADASISGADVQIAVNAATTAANTIAAGDVQFTVTGTGFADTIVTGAGTDTISAGAGDDTINGGLGADAITTGLGDDTLQYTIAESAALAANADEVSDFEVGTNVIDFTDLTNANLRGTGASYEVVAAGANAVAANTGIVEQNGNLGDLLVATVLTAANTMTGWAANDAVYFVGTDGTDTGLYFLDDTAGDGTLDTATIVAIFTGVDVTDFAAANFADFS